MGQSGQVLLVKRPAPHIMLRALIRPNSFLIHVFHVYDETLVINGAATFFACCDRRPQQGGETWRGLVGGESSYDWTGFAANQLGLENPGVRT